MNCQIAFWDMDHTVIDNDCDVSWKEFLVTHGIAPQSDLILKDRFYQDYLENRLDFTDFMAFQLREFCDRSEAEIRGLCRQHFSECVAATIYADAVRMIAAQRAAGVIVYLLTATNRYIAEPVAEYLQVDHVAATELALQDGRFTGSIDGIYCCGEGKAEVLAACAARHGVPLQACAYYGDSTADISVLRTVGHPYAVNPGPKLRLTAENAGWPILAFSQMV